MRQGRGEDPTQASLLASGPPVVWPAGCTLPPRLEPEPPRGRRSVDGRKSRPRCDPGLHAFPPASPARFSWRFRRMQRPQRNRRESWAEWRHSRSHPRRRSTQLDGVPAAGRGNASGSAKPGARSPPKIGQRAPESVQIVRVSQGGLVGRGEAGNFLSLEQSCNSNDLGRYKDAYPIVTDNRLSFEYFGLRISCLYSGISVFAGGM